MLIVTIVASLRLCGNSSAHLAGATVMLDPGRPMTLRVERSARVLWEGIPRRWKPWKLAVADVDGDSKPEILVALHKSTRHFQKPHNCMFVYGFDGKTVTPRWLGSRLGRDFSDFAASDGLLYVLETSLDGRKCLGEYKWNGFGFTRIAESGRWTTAKLLGAHPTGATVQAEGRKLLITRHQGDPKK